MASGYRPVLLLLASLSLVLIASTHDSSAIGAGAAMAVKLPSAICSCHIPPVPFPEPPVFFQPPPVPLLQVPPPPPTTHIPPAPFPQPPPAVYMKPSPAPPIRPSMVPPDLIYECCRRNARDVCILLCRKGCCGI